MLFVVHQGIVQVEQGQSWVDDHGRCYRHHSNSRVTRLESIIPVCQCTMDTGSCRTAAHAHILSLPGWLPFTATIEG